jgi:YebC/PmpR family DNA-binding regulatory protein
MFSILSKELTIAAKEGGGDPEFNPRLRTCIANAKTANMPADNVTKAIKKGTGDIPGVCIEEVTYEGYGPGGIGIMVEATTDNKNRTVAEVRSTFSKNGGNMANSGALAFIFQRKGQFIVAKSAMDENQLMEIALGGGAEDIDSGDENYEILCPFELFYSLSQLFEREKIVCQSSQIAFVPLSVIEPSDDDQKRAIALLEKLENLDDVTNVYANM